MGKLFAAFEKKIYYKDIAVWNLYKYAVYGKLKCLYVIHMK